MSLPPLAPYPANELQRELLPEEWEACMDSWILLTHAHLLLPQKLFSTKLNKDPSLTEFLCSYLHQNTSADSIRNDSFHKSKMLKSNVFFLVHRSFTDGEPTPLSLLEVSCLEDLSMVCGSSTSLRELLGKTWVSKGLESGSSSFRKRKSYLISLLEGVVKSVHSGELEDALHRTAFLLRLLYQYGHYLMVGSDLLDALATCYENKAPLLQKKLVTITYLCLSSLMEPESPRISTLIDHLYTLKDTSGHGNLLKAICSSTPFLRKMRARLSGSEAARGKNLLHQLSAFETTPNGRPRRLIKRKVDKGKSKATGEFGHSASSNVHVHKMTLITQIQDLFPDLGSAFTVKLLDEYKDDVEQVTVHLLEDSLPVHLKQADRTENLSTMPARQASELVPELGPRSTPPLASQADNLGPNSRRTVFDDDAFSNLAISPSQLHRGKATDTSQTADSLLSAPSSTSHKAAILSALAAFDSDDDERDDTYDVEDVGGTVDSAQPGTSDDVMDAESLKQDQHEETLFQAWKMSPQLFARDPTTRRSQARVALSNETRMTDEAIEGWAIMLQRDPRKLKRLEAKSSMAVGGQQRGLGKTAWTNTPTGSGTATEEEGDTDGDAASGARGGRGSTRARGRGRGRGGRGGNVAGPADDRGTQAARQSKDASKGSRANHNRRDQRAKKMARGGFPG